MPKPTMVTFKSGFNWKEYTHWIIDEENKEFICRYDGTNAELSIYFFGARVLGVLNLVLGLLQPESNFKEKLFERYPDMDSKELKKISFESNSGYKFEVLENSDPYELMKEYYRFYRYEIREGDTEEDIEEREKKLFWKRLGEKYLNHQCQVVTNN